MEDFYKHNKNLILNFLPKKFGQQLLINYFKKKILPNEISFYVKNLNKDIKDYVLDPDNSELNNLLLDHIEIVVEYLDNLSNQPDSLRILFASPNSNIKIVYIEDGLFFDNVFVIDDIIFINYDKLVRIFMVRENHFFDKKLTIPAYMLRYDDKILDKLFIKSLFKGFCYRCQYNNLDLWIKYIELQYKCKIVNKSNLSDKLLNKIPTKNKLYNPNLNWLDNYIIMFKIKNKFYLTESYWEKSISDIVYSSYYSIKYFQIVDSFNIKEKTNIDVLNDMMDNIFVNEVEKISFNLFNFF